MGEFKWAALAAFDANMQIWNRQTSSGSDSPENPQLMLNKTWRHITLHLNRFREITDRGILAYLQTKIKAKVTILKSDTEI